MHHEIFIDKRTLFRYGKVGLLFNKLVLTFLKNFQSSQEGGDNVRKPPITFSSRWLKVPVLQLS
jgi:hypothetical protein